MQKTCSASVFKASLLVSLFLASKLPSWSLTMMVYRFAMLLLGLLAFIAMLLHLTVADCPLDLNGSNFTLAASMCCSNINAFIAVSIARYANATSNLGVASNLTDICLHSISQTMQLHGIPSNATVFCGLGMKIPLRYECKGRSTVSQMLESPKFMDVAQNCRLPPLLESDCKRSLNDGIIYLHHLVGTDNNVSLSTCGNATFIALGSNLLMLQQLKLQAVSSEFNVPLEQPPSAITFEAPPSPLTAAGPSQVMLGLPLKTNHHPYHLMLVPIIGIAVTAAALVMPIVLIFLIRTKNREIEESDNINKTFSRAFPPMPTRKFLLKIEDFDSKTATGVLKIEDFNSKDYNWINVTISFN